MANNYTQTSFIIPLTLEQIEYALNLCQRLENSDEEDDELREKILEETEFLGFNYTKSPDGLWIYHEDSAYIGNIIGVITHLVDTFKLPPIGFEYSYTCDKPRCDEFGGGAVWISQNETREMSTYSWLVNQQ